MSPPLKLEVAKVYSEPDSLCTFSNEKSPLSRPGFEKAKRPFYIPSGVLCGHHRKWRALLASRMTDERKSTAYGSWIDDVALRMWKVLGKYPAMLIWPSLK